MLTGKTKYRVGWRGRLILQVEEAWTTLIDLNGSGYYDEGHHTRWRDATAADLINGSVKP